MSDKALYWHRAHGRWRVRYPDGYVSQPFTRDTAKTYQSLFGGTIERVPGREPWYLRVGRTIARRICAHD